MKISKTLTAIALLLGVTTMVCRADAEPPASLHELLGDTFVNAAGETIGTEALEGKEVIALYFSAVWCPPCRAFTPRLVEAANELREAGKPFEVVFVSRDRNADAMLGYMRDYNMPWVALPFGNAKIQELARRYSIRGIPALVVVDGNGKVITTQGRQHIQRRGAKAFETWTAASE